jgi:hypothetical protein
VLQADGRCCDWFRKNTLKWGAQANASRIFDSYIVTVGRGATLNMNIPPERTGKPGVRVNYLCLQISQPSSLIPSRVSRVSRVSHVRRVSRVRRARACVCVFWVQM